MSAASAQGLTAGTIRTNMTNAGMGTTHTIKVAAGTTQAQTQAIVNALQQQQQMQRQNSGQNLRLQGGSLVAVTVQPQPQPQPQPQQPQTQNQQLQQTTQPAIVAQQSSTESVDSTAGTTPQNQSQQVRNIVKKRIQSYRVTKPNP